MFILFYFISSVQVCTHSIKIVMLCFVFNRKIFILICRCHYIISKNNSLCNTYFKQNVCMKYWIQNEARSFVFGKPQLILCFLKAFVLCVILCHHIDILELPLNYWMIVVFLIRVNNKNAAKRTSIYLGLFLRCFKLMR